MDLMALIYFLIIGAVAGWLSGQIMKGSGFGIIGNMVVGVIGSVIGGWLFSLFDIQVGNALIGSILTAVAGAIVLLWIARLVKS